MHQKVKNARILFKVLALFTLMFFAMSVVYGVMNNQVADIIPGWIRILKTASLTYLSPNI